MRDSILIFTENLDYIEELTDEQAGQLFKALLRSQGRDEETEIADISVRILYKSMLNQIERCNAKYDETRRKRSEAGKKGNEARWGTNRSQTIASDRNGSQSDRKNRLSIPNPNPNPEYKRIAERWNQITGLTQIKSISGKRRDALKARIAEHGIENVIEAIGQIENSAFLRGQNDRGWRITFDWFVKPSNFQKVFEGTYADTAKQIAVQRPKQYTGRTYNFTELERNLIMAQMQ